MDSIKNRLSALRAQIRLAEMAAQRPAGAVELVAVSKTRSAAELMQAYLAGQRHFGENYLQEALAKQAALGACNITWHFIGPIQANKTKAIAQHFTWVHSVDRLKIAQRLSEQRPVHMPPLQVCLQVNISQESTKSGIMLHELPGRVAEVRALPRLVLRGVMVIPEPVTEVACQRQSFKMLHDAVVQLQLPELDTFSMGMSDDFDAAIAEGSTLVRIGTALFGTRA